MFQYKFFIFTKPSLTFLLLFSHNRVAYYEMLKSTSTANGLSLTQEKPAEVTLCMLWAQIWRGID